MRKELMQYTMAFALVFAGTLGAQSQSASSPWSGTWKLDVAKSKFHNPMPKSETLVIPPVDAASTTVKFTIHIVNADGTTTDISYNGKTDGTHYPQIANGKDTIAMVTFSRTSSHVYTSHSLVKAGGTMSATHTMTQDNHTFTSQVHGTDSKGAYDQTEVWVRS